MSSETIAAVSTVITAIVSAIAGAIVLVLNARSGNKARETTERQNEYEKIIGRYEKDIARREAHSDNQQIVIDKLQEANSQLREKFAAVRGRYEMIFSYAKRQFEFMRKSNISAEPPPTDLPPEDKTDADSDNLDFNIKQVQQGSVVLKKTKPQPPPGTKIPPDTGDEIPAIPKDTPTTEAPPSDSGGPSS